MIHLIVPVATLLGWSYALFLFFLAYVTVMQAKESGRLDDANWLFRLAAGITIVVGGIIDIGFNVVLGTILFLELPELHNITFTHRCAKWMTNSGWRGSIARAICKNLSVFDVDHCKPRS